MAAGEAMAIAAAVGGIIIGILAGISIGVSIGKGRQTQTRIIPVARKIDGRVVSKYTRAERRAYKRRRHG